MDPRLTLSDVELAAFKILKEQGRPPTANMLLQTLGSGSMTTIVKYLKAIEARLWENAAKGFSSEVPPQLVEALQAVLSTAREAAAAEFEVQRAAISAARDDALRAAEEAQAACAAALSARLAAEAIADENLGRATRAEARQSALQADLEGQQQRLHRWAGADKAYRRWNQGRLETLRANHAAALAALLSKLSAADNQLVKALDDAQRTKSHFEENENRLFRLVDQLRQELSGAQAALRASSQEFDARRRDMEARLVEQDKQIALLKADLAHKDEQLGHCKSTLAENNRQIVALKETSNGFQEESVRYRIELADLRPKIAELHLANTSMRNEIDALKNPNPKKENM